ncbi:Trm112 family protein [Marinoscillum sp.]|uniref:Trm112 family protein n=1 Tax=Marinoscillum sp. TaxID=2024838 RepID=UPI003BAC524A
MKKSFFKKLCCPFDKSDLEISVIREADQEILEGLMTCTTCARYYPIIHGIPIMSPDEYRQPALEAPILQRWGLEIGEVTNFRLTEQVES